MLKTLQISHIYSFYNGLIVSKGKGPLNYRRNSWNGPLMAGLRVKWSITGRVRGDVHVNGLVQ